MKKERKGSLKVWEGSRAFVLGSRVRLRRAADLWALPRTCVEKLSSFPSRSDLPGSSSQKLELMKNNGGIFFYINMYNVLLVRYSHIISMQKTSDFENKLCEKKLIYGLITITTKARWKLHLCVCVCVTERGRERGAMLDWSLLIVSESFSLSSDVTTKSTLYFALNLFLVHIFWHLILIYRCFSGSFGGKAVSQASLFHFSWVK